MRRARPSAVIARIVRPMSLVAVAALAACGGSNNNSTTLSFISPFAVIGQANFSSGTANRGGATAGNTLARAQGGVATNGNSLYIADTGNSRVLAYNSIPSGDAPANFAIGQASLTANASGTGATQMAFPTKAALDLGASPAIQFAVADTGNNRVLLWKKTPTSATVSAGPDFVLGTGTAGTTATQLSNPTAVALGNGKVVVADQGNNRVLIWNQSDITDGTPTAHQFVIGHKNATTSQANDNLNDTTGGVSQGGLNGPADVWTNGVQLLVADTGNNRVMVYSQIPSSSGALANFVIGQTDFSRNGAGVSQISLNAPNGVAADSTGSLVYIADTQNNRVVKLNSFPIANGPAFSVVYGQDYTNFSNRTSNDADQNGADDGAPSQNTLSGPSGVTVANGVLYVTDRGNHRVLEYPQ